jgi:hypothetical protein
LVAKLERARDYRDYAAQLLRSCERATSDPQRAVLADLAATYHRLAEQLEEMHRLGDSPEG